MTIFVSSLSVGFSLRQSHFNQRFPVLLSFRDFGRWNPGICTPPKVTQHMTLETVGNIQIIYNDLIRYLADLDQGVSLLLE